MKSIKKMILHTFTHDDDAFSVLLLVALVSVLASTLFRDTALHYIVLVSDWLF